MPLQRCHGSIGGHIGTPPRGCRPGLKRHCTAQPLDERIASHAKSGPSGRILKACKTSCVRFQVTAQLLGPPVFDPRKLSTTFLPGSTESGPLPPAPRRYTLTHNDLTGQLRLSIGSAYNRAQVSGWYTRLIRDEVLAEWLFDGEGQASLHVHCHVSGEERWLAPPALRNYIFQREMPLVLNTVLHADRVLLSQLPCFENAAVVVHLTSHIKELHTSMQWGRLSQHATWPSNPLPMGWGLAGTPTRPPAAAAVPLADAAEMPPLSPDGLESRAADDALILMPDAGVDVRLTDASGNGLAVLAEVSAEEAAALVLHASAVDPQSQAVGLETAGGDPMAVHREGPGEDRLIVPQGRSDDEAQWPHRGGQAESSAAPEVGHTALEKCSEQCSEHNQQLQNAAQERSNGMAQPPEPGSSGDTRLMSVSTADASKLSAVSSLPEQAASMGTLGRGGLQSASVQPASNGHSHPLPPSRLECDGIERLLAESSKPITARGIVSEWLASGHEVVTVRL